MRASAAQAVGGDVEAAVGAELVDGAQRVGGGDEAQIVQRGFAGQAEADLAQHRGEALPGLEKQRPHRIGRVRRGRCAAPRPDRSAHRSARRRAPGADRRAAVSLAPCLRTKVRNASHCCQAASQRASSSALSVGSGAGGALGVAAAATSKCRSSAQSLLGGARIAQPQRVEQRGGLLGALLRQDQRQEGAQLGDRLLQVDRHRLQPRVDVGSSPSPTASR